jgi:heat shock protein HspQ
MASTARFNVGQIVHHTRFDYRGVIIDVDADFQGSDEWYESVARSRPPRDKPWYHVLVDNADHITYVAERHLEADDSGEPIVHPGLEHFFDAFRDGHYLRRGTTN